MIKQKVEGSAQAVLIKGPTIGQGSIPAEKDSHFQFEILLDHQYPFSAPQLFCYTKFTNIIDLYDGRDLYAEVMNNEEWRVAKNLHEIIMGIPDFIEMTK